MIVFVDGYHLSGPYKGTLLAACAIDADNSLFIFAFAIVSPKSVRRMRVILAKCCRLLGGFEACNYVELMQSAFEGHSTSFWKRKT